MRKQLGITLLETVLAIAVSAAVVVLGVRYYQQAHLGAEVVQAGNQLDKIVQASYTWLQGQRQADFEGSDNAIDIDKLVSSGLLSDADKTDPWGGSVAVAPASDNNYVSITFPNTPKKACQDLSAQMSTVVQSETSTEDCASGKGYSGEF